MKTRIKIVEYNSGNKEFICQFDAFDTETFLMLFKTIIFIPVAIIMVFTREWKSLPAIFSTEEEAKKFIDKWILEQEAKKKEKFEAKIKKTYYQKYP